MNKSPKRQSISAHSLWDTLNADKMVGEFKHKKSATLIMKHGA